MLFLLLPTLQNVNLLWHAVLIVVIGLPEYQALEPPNDEHLFQPLSHPSLLIGAHELLVIQDYQAEQSSLLQANAFLILHRPFLERCVQALLGCLHFLEMKSRQFQNNSQPSHTFLGLNSHGPVYVQ